MFGACGSASIHVETPSLQRPDFDTLQESVAALVSPRGQTYCSAVFVAERRLVTAQHCIDQVGANEAVLVATYRQYIDSKGKMTLTSRWRVQRQDDGADIATLVPEAGERVGPHEYLKVGRAPRTGDPVWLMGHPIGNEYTLTDGVVSRGKRTKCEAGRCTYWVQSSAPGYYGNSGGALVDASGELIGITSHGDGMFDIVPHLLFHVHTDTIRDFLSQ